MESVPEQEERSFPAPRQDSRVLPFSCKPYLGVILSVQSWRLTVTQLSGSTTLVLASGVAAFI
eukprot:scaffold514053_cov31-Prasinocladus_malaysianus.AAC.1